MGTELCMGGLLIDRIVEAGTFSEVHAAILMKQIFRAVYFMHQNSVCHRDLTLDKFVFASKAPMEESVLKLADLESACFFEEGETLCTKFKSSSALSAPELLDGKYNQKCDLWSCGVMMFILLSGRPPITGQTEKEIHRRMYRADFDFNPKYWSKVSEDAKHLVRKLLKVRMQDRISSENALNHSWIVQKAPKAASSLNLDFLNELKSLRNQTKLKKITLQVMVGQFTECQLGSLREIFNELDLDGDGMLTIKEMSEGLNRAGLDDIPLSLQQSIEDIDLDGSGSIDYSEFLAAALEEKDYLREDACWNAFSFFDRDGDGRISLEELRQVLSSHNLQQEVGQARLELALREVDRNGDGEIDFDEFMEK